MSRRGLLLRVGAFLVLSIFLAATTWRLLSGPGLPDQTTYRAVFNDVSNLKKGDDVKVAGVAVGAVKDVEVDARAGRATVTFGVDAGLTLTSQTRAGVKYKNLTGDRFLSLSQGIAPATNAAKGTDLQPASFRSTRGTPLARGGEIPLARTQPALDLDALFGGFQPLFEALTPDQINKLSGELVQVLQGEGGTVMDLLRDVADFTVTLADRSAVIGKVVNNLNVVLTSFTDHTPEFEAAIDSAQKLTTGLASQRAQLAEGLAATQSVTDTLATTLQQARPDLLQTSTQIQRLSALLTTKRNAAVVSDKLGKLPQAYRLMAGFGSYGAWSNFYLCGLGATSDGGDLKMITVDTPRCQW